MNQKILYVSSFEHKELSKKCYSDLFNFFDSSSKLQNGIRMDRGQKKSIFLQQFFSMKKEELQFKASKK